MKKIVFGFLVLALCPVCLPQNKFNDFIKSFNDVKLPIDNLLNISDNDTIVGIMTNDIIIRSQQKKPQYLDKDGNIKTTKQYYGLYPEKPDSYLKDIKNNSGKYEEKRFFFYPKIIPIGSIKLIENFESIVIKVVAFETTFYDLWNFSKDGKALSVVCLFWGMRDAGPSDEKVTFTIVDSKITKEGEIIWHENADGLETFRTYKLNNEGYFQILKEEKKGKAEF